MKKNIGLNCDMATPSGLSMGGPARENARTALRSMARDMRERGGRLIDQAAGIEQLVESLSVEQCEPGVIEEALSSLCMMAQNTNPNRSW